MCGVELESGLYSPPFTMKSKAAATSPKTGIRSAAVDRICLVVSAKFRPLVLAPYSKPQKVGNRTKDNLCWDSIYIALKD